MDGNIKDTPPTVFVPAPADRDRWNALGRPSWPSRASSDRGPQARRPGPSSTSGSPRPDAATRSTATRSRREGQRLKLQRARRDCGDGEGRPRPASSRPAALESSPTPATSSRTRRSPTAPGSSIAKAGADRRGHRPDGRQHGLSGLGPLARERHASATHIIHKWPDDALKVVADDRRSSRASGTTCSSPTTARARPPACKIYLNGEPQADRRRSRRPARARSGPTVPFKVGQRHTTSQARRRRRSSDLRIYGRALSPSEVERARRRRPRRAYLVAQAGRQADRRPRSTQLFDWWLGHDDPASQELAGEARGARAGAGRDQGAGHDRPRDAGEDRAGRWPTSCSAASTTSAATR